MIDMWFNEESHLHHPLVNQRFREYVIQDRNLQIKNQKSKINYLPIPISRAPSSTSIPAATIVTDRNQIKPVHNPC